MIFSLQPMNPNRSRYAMRSELVGWVRFDKPVWQCRRTIAGQIAESSLIRTELADFLA